LLLLLPMLLCAAGGVGRPLVVIISRLTQQKGLPLMLHGMQVRHAPGGA
jgi:glycogen synthase